jgi:hypothetical protein
VLGWFLKRDLFPRYDLFSMTLQAVSISPLDNKLEELILFVAAALGPQESCCATKTKLDKILFSADFRAYDALGRSITGQRYLKLEGGPVPDGIASVLETMEGRGWCDWSDRGLRALREPDLKLFAPEEIEITRAVIDDLADLSAGEVSERSHRFPGWQAAELGEEIPYDTVFVDQPRPLTPEEVAWAEEIIGDFLVQRQAS